MEARTRSRSRVPRWYAWLRPDVSAARKAVNAAGSAAFAFSVKRSGEAGLYLSVTRVYDGGADSFDPDKLIREAVSDGDLIAAATIALESYGWQLYRFIVRQVQPSEVDEVFTRVADELLRGLHEMMVQQRVRDWIYTLVHGAWIRTQAGDPKRPLANVPGFQRWVQQVSAGYRAASGLEVRSISGGGRTLVVAGGGGAVRAPVRTAEGSGAMPIHPLPSRKRTQTEVGMPRHSREPAVASARR